MGFSELKAIVDENEMLRRKVRRLEGELHRFSQAEAVNALLRGYAQLITVVSGEDRETAIYLNGELQGRVDTNDACEIARVTGSLPCRVTTRNPVGWECDRNWPQSLADVPTQ